MADPASADPGVVLGTAGHIDHGKTRLIGALTGVDTDRLEEERRRGISIELGFAELRLEDGSSVGIVDVPGHERLVRAMVSGAGGIDAYLLVVAADDGVMPQTREHLTVLKALGVERGIVALNKIDLATPETLLLAREEIAALLPDVPIVEVSATGGEGIEELRAEIARLVAAGARAEAGDEQDGLLHVDRSFTIAGAGTVVTGTVVAGRFSAGETVGILPGDATARVRGIQVHGRAVERVGAGRRAALNLAGIAPADVPRGMALATSDVPQTSFRLDVRVLGDLDPAAIPRRVQVHLGTRDVPARVVALGGGLLQLRLEGQLVARAADRAVLRSPSPPATLGGAEVIDPDPRRHGPGPEAERLRGLVSAPLPEAVRIVTEAAEAVPADPAQWRRDARLAYVLHRFGRSAILGELQAKTAAGALVETGHGSLRVRAEDAEQVPDDVAPRSPGPEGERLLEMIAADGLEPRAPQTLADELGMPLSDVTELLRRLVASGDLVRAGGEVYYLPGQLGRLEQLVGELARRRGSLTIAELRDALHTSRKYAQAILEHLDGTGVTVRQGDSHVPREQRGS